MSEQRGVRPEDVAMAAKSNLSVDARGGAHDTGSARARLRRMLRMFAQQKDTAG